MQPALGHEEAFYSQKGGLLHLSHYSLLILFFFFLFTYMCSLTLFPLNQIGQKREEINLGLQSPGLFGVGMGKTKLNLTYMYPGIFYTRYFASFPSISCFLD